MTTTNVGFRADHEFKRVLQIRAKQLGFKNLSDYQRSLNRYDLLIAKAHLLTGELHKMSDEEQARFDKRLCAAYIAGDTADGTWMERAIAQVVQEFGIQEKVDMHAVAERLRLLLDQ